MPLKQTRRSITAECDRALQRLPAWVKRSAFVGHAIGMPDYAIETLVVEGYKVPIRPHVIARSQIIIDMLDDHF